MFYHYTEKIVQLFTPQKIVLCLIITGSLLYVDSLFNGFVMDDQGLILKNQNIQSFQLLHFFQGSIFDYGGSLAGVYYRPLQSILFASLFAVFGAHAFMYHVVQVILHITNAVLLFFFCKKYLDNILAFFIGLIFLIHPMQVEAVSYIASMQDVLFVFWGLIYLLTLRNMYTSPKWFFIPYIFLLCSLLSKESGFLFFPLGIAYIALFEKKEKMMHGFFLTGVLFLYLFLRVLIAGIGIHSTSEFAMMRLPLLERVIHIPAIVLFYLKTFFFPYDLVAVQSWVISTISFDKFFLPLLIDGLFFMCLFIPSFFVLKKKRNSALLFFWVWFLGGLALHIQITPLDVTVADRYFYFPMIGLLGIIGVSIKEMPVFQKMKRGHIFITIICLFIWITFLAGRTIVRNVDWRDTKTLALHDLPIQPDNYQLLSGLGAMYLEEKEYPKAIYYLKKSTSIYPYWGTSQYNLGVSYHMSNHPQEAKIYYEKSIKNSPSYVNAYENMAILLYYNYPPQQARGYTKENLKKFPRSLKMLQVLYLSDQKLGETKEASQTAELYNFLTTSH